MFSQEKTGKFIALCRKEKGMTQRQLAEELSVSDKTISKWETGNGMPDTSIMEALCGVLEINVNELLSGERLSNDGYSKKAEENMMTLMKEKETDQGMRLKRLTITLTLVGAACCMLVLWSFANLRMLLGMVDIPSVLFVFGMVLLGLGLSGYMRFFLHGCALLLKKGTIPETAEATDYKKAVEAFSFASLIALLGGFSGMLWSLTGGLVNLDDIQYLGALLSVSGLPVFYGTLFSFLLLIGKGRLAAKL